jgi:DNA gyrase inhibitor
MPMKITISKKHMKIILYHVSIQNVGNYMRRERETMDVRVDTLPSYRIAYVRQIGPYGPANVQAMEAIKRWAMGKGLLTESAILFGIPQDDPQATPPQKCRYDACIAIANEVAVDDCVSKCEVHGGQYVVFRIKHTAEDIQRAWAGLFPALHRMGYSIDSKPILEKYNGNMANNDYCEICVPIKML